ncbi:large subunit ribosomal protein L25 [Rhodopseudomonas julia]|uniref:Large ribosomal subunit protein bL25 n=1 Tax=Rhodopseudomonas julia TaxID=200617 RepID=A0ABU0CAK8_9BRAD|nr:50S ribosomal protein L25/general stress protein Ctc [Rhodopseudomonas julia]MDQ0327514.1 large subunit ribosomal protein L25 [Rhodopseudomonas julia]
MSHTYELTAEVRERSGKGAARAVRREGKVPAVIYGDKKPATPIALNYKELNLKLRAGGFLTTVATINVDGDKVRVIPKDYQLDPVRGFLMHVDFLRVSRGTTLTLELPVHFINEEEAPGLTRGGVLNVVRHTVEVHVPADQIPENLVADLAGLDIGDSVHISNIALPEGVTPTITDRDFTVATIAAPASLISEESEEEAEGEEPEVEGEGDEEEETEE